MQNFLILIYVLYLGAERLRSEPERVAEYLYNVQVCIHRFEIFIIKPLERCDRFCLGTDAGAGFL
jgi:hypothetical protein